MITKPTEDKINWAPNEADVEIPSGAKQSLGFILREKFGSKIANGMFKRVCQWLNWASDRVEAHETVANVTFDLTTVAIADVQTFLDDLKHNDYSITLTGNYDDNSTLLTIKDISGTGTISFTGNVTIGGLLISNVANSVTFPFGSELNIEQATGNGLHVINSPYVYIDTLNSTFQFAPPISTWLLVKLVNSIVTIKAPDFDGSFTSASAPTHLIRVDSTSKLYITNDYSVTTNAVEGASIGRSIVKVEDGGFYAVTATPTFVNWEKNYACQFEMIKYDKAPFIYYISITEEALFYTPTIVSNIATINGNVKLIIPFHVGGTYQEISDLNIDGINGYGSLYIEYAEFVLNNIINNSNITINLHVCKIDDSDVSGEYGLSIVNCRNILFETQTLLNGGSNSYDALLIDNSNCIIDDIVYEGHPIPANINYLSIQNNANILFKKITSGYSTTAHSKFINITDGCRVHIKEWVAADAYTTDLQFNGISNASYVIGYTSANKYILATTPSDISIVELP